MDNIPQKELAARLLKTQMIMAKQMPNCDGFLIFTHLFHYYYTGSMVNGILWIPRCGDSILLCRRGHDRAVYDSVNIKIVNYRSFGDIKSIIFENEEDKKIIGIDMRGVNLETGNLLQTKLPTYQFVSADNCINYVRSVKTNWEMAKIRKAGELHDFVYREEIPKYIRPGMSEWEIGKIFMKLMLEAGHLGITRLQNFGEEVLTGMISSGKSGNHPSIFNGPLGTMGLHPSAPFLGNAEKIWTANEPLTIDSCFSYQGYMTDKTATYWSSDCTIEPETLDIYNASVNLQNNMAKLLVPGNIPENIYFEFLEQAQKLGVADGVMGLKNNKVSFLGHGIGLFIDELPVIAKGFKQPLEANMVIALEPKIGIPDYGMIGVENTFIVTPNGGKSVTGNKFDPIIIG